MAENRLCGLALMCIHKNIEIDTDKVQKDLTVLVIEELDIYFNHELS